MGAELARALASLDRDVAMQIKRDAGGGTPWSDGSVLVLRALWGQGLSASQIAAQLIGEPLRLGVSRNAVISKLHRLGLTRNEPRLTRKPKRAHNPLGLPKKPKRQPPPKSDNHKPKGAPKGEHNIPHSKASVRVHCEYFLEGEDGPDGLVCGRAVEFGSSWCAHCKALIYQPETAQRKRAA